MGVLMASAAMSEVLGQQTARPAARERLAEALALTVYAGWLVFVALHHEGWFDEMQAWLLARDNSLPALIGHYVRYEGTPGLWHALLWCASHAGLPFASIWVISVALALAGGALIVRHAPFPLPLRLGLLATYFYGYQFSVIARGYSLDLLLVPLAAVLFATRLDKPLRYGLVVGLLANVNVFSFLVAGLLGIELLVRLVLARRVLRPSALGGLAIAGAMGLFALWSAWQPADNGFLAQTHRLSPVAGAFIYMANGLFDRVTPGMPTHQVGVDVVAGIAASLAVLGLVARLVWAGRDRALMLTIPVMLIGFASVIYAGSWHAGMLFVFVLFVLWTQWTNPVGARTRTALVIALALLELAQGIQTVSTGLQDVTGDYSAGRRAAAAITAWKIAHPGQGVAAFGGQSFEVQPWLPGNPYSNYHQGAPNPQFVVWTTAETWHALPAPREWGELLKTRPAAILASKIWLPKPVQRDAERQICRAGYRTVQVVPASMAWRGIPEDNTLMLLERADNGACHQG